MRPGIFPVMQQRLDGNWTPVAIVAQEETVGGSVTWGNFLYKQTPS